MEFPHYLLAAYNHLIQIALPLESNHYLKLRAQSLIPPHFVFSALFLISPEPL
jgi:hypothetical protein